MVRSILPVFIRRWGLLAVGVVLVLGGLIWGLTSHQVVYQDHAQDPTYQLSSGQQSGNVYINESESNEYFAAFQSDFAPTIASSDLDRTAEVSFVARADTSTLDPKLSIGGATISAAHKIEKLVLYDQNGSIIRIYATAEYEANPNGFYQNEWANAIWLIFAGLLISSGSILYPLLAQPQVQANVSTNSQPYAQPRTAEQGYQYPQQATPTEPYAPQHLVDQPYQQAPQE